MKTHILSLLIFICLATQAFSQNGIITLRSVSNPDRTISINAESLAYGDYTIRISFKTLQGYRGSGIFGDVGIFVVQRGNRELVKLEPEKSATVYSYGYSYSYFPGNYLNKAPSDTGFLYLLPGTLNNIVRISKVSSFEASFGKPVEDAFFGTGFSYASGDTICAARAGLVYDCSDEQKESEKGKVIFKRTNNQILIQQRDGSLAQYTVRAPIKLLVEKGDNVIPGQPIAVFNKENEGYEMILSVRYLDGKKISAIRNNSDGTIVNAYRFLPTIFCIGEDGHSSSLQMPNQTFKVAYPKELIGKELSKKEKKKLGLL